MTGRWNVVLTMPQGSVPLAAALKQDGESVTGTISSPLGEQPVAGTMVGTTLRAEFKIATPQGDMVVSMIGELSPTGLTGKSSVAGLGESDWVGQARSITHVTHPGAFSVCSSCWRCSHRRASRWRRAWRSSSRPSFRTVRSGTRASSRWPPTWKQATGDRVSVTVFSGGSQGDESSVLRKMRLDALQAASLTVVGLAAIDPAFNVFNVPFFFDSYDELNAVVTALTPTLKQRVEAKGFVLLNWGHGGWLQVFTKRPVQTVADLKGVKLYTSAGDDRMTQWYKANGFQPRAMAMTDVLTGLTTGMIDGLPTPPVAALAFQWNRQTPFMLDVGLAPVVGATVITRKTWQRIADADRVKLSAAALTVEKQLQVDVPKQDAFAVLLMQQQGLTVTKASGPEWRREGEALAATMRGEMVPKDIFDLAVKERDAFRQQKTAAGHRPVIRALVTLEDIVAGLALAVMVALPLLEIVVRHAFGVGVPASGPIVQHLTLWVGFLGAAIAAREGKLLSLATGTLVPAGAPRRAAAIARGGSRRGGRGGPRRGARSSWCAPSGTPARRLAPAFPPGSHSWCCRSASRLIAVRLVWRASAQWRGRLFAACGLAVGAVVLIDPGAARRQEPVAGAGAGDSRRRAGCADLRDPRRRRGGAVHERRRDAGGRF